MKIIKKLLDWTLEICWKQCKNYELPNLPTTPTFPPWPMWRGNVISAHITWFLIASPCFASKVINHFIPSQCSIGQSSSLLAPTSLKNFKNTFTCGSNSQYDKLENTYSQFSSNLFFISFKFVCGWALMLLIFGSRYYNTH
jgi:hypothetical protein